MSEKFETKWRNIFDCLRYSEKEEFDTAVNNLATDIYFARLAVEKCCEFMIITGRQVENKEGFHEFLEEKVGVNPVFRKNFNEFASLALDSLEQLVAEVKSHTAIQARLFTSGNCEAMCKECYTGANLCPGQVDQTSLTLSQSLDYLKQAKSLGARLLYIAGKGEPPQDPKFIPLIDSAENIGFELLFFTNGIMLSNNQLMQEKWGMSLLTLMELLTRINANIYHKLWSLKRGKFTDLLGLCGFDYQQMHFIPDTFKGQRIFLPRGLALHLEKGDIRNVGVEFRIGTDTYDEVRELIIPWVMETGIRSYGEPQISSGRGFHKASLQCSEEQLADPLVAKYLVRVNCRHPSYSIVVLHDGTMSFCLSVEPEMIRKHFDRENALGIKRGEGIKNIYIANHSHPFLMKTKYRWEGCTCQTVNNELRSL